MIYEVRIFSRIGSSIYAAEMEIKQGRIESRPIESPSLFSSMMSAILSFDSEVQRTQVREFIYENNKAVLHFLDEIAFLIYADNKVKNKDLSDYLLVLSRLWLEHFEDKEYMMMTSKQLELVNQLVDQALDEVFWWINPYPTPKKLTAMLFNTLIRPNSTYYFRYLSNYYHALSIIPPLFIIALAWQFSVILSGFSPDVAINPSLLSISVPIIVLWLGPGLFLKSIFGDEFHLRGYYTISGLMNFYLVPLIIFSSSMYNNLVNQISASIGLFRQFGIIFLLLAPINLVFFGYFVMTGFATSFANDVKQSRFFVAYLLTITFLISVTSVISL